MKRRLGKVLSTFVLVVLIFSMFSMTVFAIDGNEIHYEGENVSFKDCDSDAEAKSWESNQNVVTFNVIPDDGFELVGNPQAEKFGGGEIVEVYSNRDKGPNAWYFNMPNYAVRVWAVTRKLNSPTPEPSQTSESAPAPEVKRTMTTTNMNGAQSDSWEAVAEKLEKFEANNQVAVEDANQDLLHVDISDYYKTIPKAVADAASASKGKGVHVFIGGGNAVTFLSKASTKDYKEADFDFSTTTQVDGKDIVFARQQDLGTNVLFHTNVGEANRTSEVYFEDDSTDRTLIGIFKSDKKGMICFDINKTGMYSIKYTTG